MDAMKIGAIVILSIIKNAGKISAIAAIIAPNRPPTFAPINVAIFTPNGPGVLSEIATKFYYIFW